MSSPPTLEGNDKVTFAPSIADGTAGSTSSEKGSRRRSAILAPPSAGAEVAPAVASTAEGVRGWAASRTLRQLMDGLSRAVCRRGVDTWAGHSMADAGYSSSMSAGLRPVSVAEGRVSGVE